MAKAPGRAFQIKYAHVGDQLAFFYSNHGKAPTAPANGINNLKKHYWLSTRPRKCLIFLITN